jgi:hypothetical protein
MEPESEPEPEPEPLYPDHASSHHLPTESEIPESHQNWPGSPAPDVSDPFRDLSAALPPYSPPPAQGYDDPAYASPTFPSSDYAESSFPEPSYSSPVPPQAEPRSRYPEPDFPSPTFPNPSYPSPSHSSAASSSAGFPSSSYAGSGFSDFPNTGLPRSNFQASSYSDAAYAAPPPAPDMRVSNPIEQHPAFERPGYAAASDRHEHEPMFPSDPDVGGMPPPHDDDFYDEQPRGGRRRGLLTVAAIFGLAVVGTAAAFGYRTLLSGARTALPPPVIRASGEPNKVAPPPSAPDPSAGKFSYDRFGDAGKDEKLLKREEKPVDLAKAVPPPPPTPPTPAPPPAASSTVTPSTNPPSAIGEPRRVRTVPIRPDQGGDVATAPPAQQPSTVTPRQANASAVAAPRGNSRVASRAAQAPVANAPLSLSPNANNPPAPAAEPAAPAPQARALPQAALPPPPAPSPAPRATAPAPARVASAPAQTSAIGGGYLVQVTSQRSEADAQAAYRGMQSKYAGVLANQPHQVRRADLGAKGTFYRAMVGPFSTREAAVQLCASLKQAGGDCVVQH